MTIQNLLSDLFLEFPFAYFGGFGANPLISGVVIDSRKIRPGDMFIAMPGGSADGHKFIPAAIANGAAAIVGEQEIVGLTVPYLRVENARRAVTYLASAFYGYPGKQLIVIGVTGTDGKTTTSNLLYQILSAAGLKVGMISTVNAVIGGEELDTGFHVTTPDAPDVQFYLAKMVAAGLTHVVLETTSHGLSQFRADAALYDIAVVTNMTHEHLNDHGSLENYYAAKARLFQLLAETPQKAGKSIRLAVLNRDEWSHGYLSEVIEAANSKSGAGIRIADYGLGVGPLVRAENVRYLPGGLEYDAVGENFRVTVASPLVGAFNLSNSLAALTAAVLGLGVEPGLAAQGISQLSGIAGRMERIDLGQNFTAIVDFAHTPNALKNAIETVRKLTDRRVLVAFGSAGLRDKQKRRMMAEVAAQLADIAVLTAEDPRTEPLDGILDEMAQGARSQGGVEGETFFRVPDRGEALRLMLRLARPGDLVMACGKGHEQSMCFGAIEYLWDDRTALRAALAEFLGIDGPKMPYLPTQGF
jgi:UDP-N-acetylmuramoyl-L-alanyl-D-glutamate--2,6-diaminopimelate ligase